MDNSKTNVLYISNLIESSYPNVFSLVEENFNIVKISTFKDLKVNFKTWKQQTTLLRLQQKKP